MTDLRQEPYIIPAAELGPENPLPVFRAREPNRAIDTEAHHIPEEDRVGLGCETGERVLPYRMQDGYTRRRETRAFASIVLENEFLRVTVLPETGGKVVSIFDKPRGRELIYRNPVFQPGNLAIRNAWTSGGIEWNTGQVGHHYLTCSPVHCAHVEGFSGSPVLRLYAWERVRQYPYQIDLHLPSGSPFLFAHVRLINPHSHELPMYWWTNIGMLEHDGGRVLAPAETAYHGLTVHQCPIINGLDYSYSTRVRRSYDLFFRIPEGRRPWEMYFDREGRGFLHMSTARLRGRKQFAWGMGQGGRRWSEYLALPDMPYLEIQAGLGYTQSHTVPMPPGTQWTWTEAMGYFEGEAAILHSENWQEACAEGGRIVEELLPAEELARLHEQMETVQERPPERLLFRGLGWGRLEQRRAQVAGERDSIPPELPFADDDLTADQQPWLELLQTGQLPAREPADDPGQFMVQEQWRELLEASVTAGRSDHWLGWLHLGVMRLEAGNTAGAEQAWHTSLQRAHNAWALRNLSVLRNRTGHQEAALQLLLQAVDAAPGVAAIAGEAAAMLLKLRRFEELDDLLERLPESVRESERLQLAAGWTALHLGRLEQVEQTLRHDFASIREGELTLSELWFALHEQRVAAAEGREVDEELKARVRREFPPPYEIDFRMTEEGGDAYVPPGADEEKSS